MLICAQTAIIAVKIDIKQISRIEKDEDREDFMFLLSEFVDFYILYIS